jgi:hypothetical protein
MLQLVPDIEAVSYAREKFPRTVSEFERLFRDHGMEVRGQPFDLNFARYRSIEFDGRLVWIVARATETRAPIGYACAFWYRDLHFKDIVASDDLWFVDKSFRRSGVGKTVKVMCHAELKKQGVVRVYDTIRATFRHATLMRDLVFEPNGIRWFKEL